MKTSPEKRAHTNMHDFQIRRISVVTEEIFHEGGPVAEQPRRRAAAFALVKNPFAGKYVADLQPAMEDLKPLGLMLTQRLVAALGGGEGIDGYGKGAIVGSAGEIEHGALWHVPGGYAMRELLGQVMVLNRRGEVGVEFVPRHSATRRLPMTPEQQALLSRTFAALADRQVNVEVKTDPLLAAGVRARIGDLIIDNSIAGQLDELHDAVALSLKERLADE